MTNRFPALSNARWDDPARSALVAGPPSPVLKGFPGPLPATVEIRPSGETLRTASPVAMKRSPAPSAATPERKPSGTPVAGMPSPGGQPEAGQEAPLPATVLMIPLGETLRMRPLLESAMKTFPLASTAMSSGPANAAFVAGPPSPNQQQPCPLPAIVVINPSTPTFRMRKLEASMRYRFPAASTATLVGSFNCAVVAGPPSPENPPLPLPPPPATVWMIPSGETRRTRSRSSEINRLPMPSTAKPNAFGICALVAGPPSPG